MKRYTIIQQRGLGEPMDAEAWGWLCYELEQAGCRLEPLAWLGDAEVAYLVECVHE